MTQSMNAKGITHYKQKQLSSLSIAIPDIGDDDVLVNIQAASINPIDFKIRDGQMKPLLSYSMPLILGNDFSGIIVKVGKHVSSFKVGDEVYGRPQKSRIGTFAEYISIDHHDIAIMPKNLSFIEAASIPLVGLTSYQALHDIMSVKPGEKILIQAGAGGVGTFAIQLAKVMGAFVATTASPAGEKLVDSLGADHIINYREESFETVLSDYDFVYDTLGGDALKKAFSIIRPGGKIVSVSGFPNKRFAKAYQVGAIKKIVFQLATLPITHLEKQTGAEYHFLFMKPSGEQLALLTTLIEQNKIKPIIDRVYSFDKIQNALDYSESGRAKGKIVISMA